MLQGGLGLLQRGLNLVDGSFRLPDLLIEFRRIDLRQRLTGSHVIPQVHKAALQIAVGSRQDGRFRQRL